MLLPVIAQLLASLARAAPAVPVWPAPRGPVSSGESTVLVSPQLSVTGGDAPDVAAGVARFLARAFPYAVPSAAALKRRGPSAAAPAASLSALALNISNARAALQFGVDESYVLSVPSDVSGPMVLSAATQFGALAGLETLAQLLDWDPPSRTYSIADAPLEIVDSPAFAWRGLLIDSALVPRSHLTAARAGFRSTPT